MRLPLIATLGGMVLQLSQLELQGKLNAFGTRLAIPGTAAALLGPEGSMVAAHHGVTERGADATRDESTIRHDDVWHLGSCTKSMSAFLYARLVEHGLTSWDVTVADLFPEVSAEPQWQQRTLTQLLHCRAGVRPNLSLRQMLRAWKDTRPLTQQRREVVEWVLSGKPASADRFRYSNVSYIMLGAAIDRLTGESYEKALTQYVLKPLGITTAAYGAPPRVLGHSVRLRLGSLLLFAGKPMLASNPRSDNPAVASSAGTLHMSVADWAKFIRQFLQGQNTLLTDDSINRLLAEPEGGRHSMCMGWIQGRGPEFVGRGMQGSNTMSSSMALLSADRKHAVLTVANDGRTRVVAATPFFAMDVLEAATTVVT